VKIQAAILVVLSAFLISSSPAGAQEENPGEGVTLQGQTPADEIRQPEVQQALEGAELDSEQESPFADSAEGLEEQEAPVQEVQEGSVPAEPAAEQQAEAANVPAEEQKAPVQKVQEGSAPAEPAAEQQAEAAKVPAEEQGAPVQEVQEGSAPAEPAAEQQAEAANVPAEEQKAPVQEVKEGSAPAEPAAEQQAEAADLPEENMPEPENKAQEEGSQGKAIGLEEARATQTEPAEDMKEEPKKEENQKINAQAEKGSKEDLLERIDELEKRLNELTEENRARRKLEITEQEKREKDKDVLEAVGREYSLDKKRSLGLDYTLAYNYSPSNRITNQLIVDKESDHTIRHIVSSTYGIEDNVSSTMSIPFVYRYNKMGTESEIDETDIGDISLGVSYQPWVTKVGDVTKTFTLSVVLPTGRSPYEVNPETELSTGDGVYSLGGGGSFSMQVDPVVVFWNASYTYNFDATGINHTVGENYVLEKVKTGNSWGVGAGLAYAMSYKVSVNTSINYSYTYSSEYHYRNATSALKSGDDVSATFGLGFGWKVSNKTTLSLNLGYGLTDTGFSLSVRVPFNFML